MAQEKALDALAPFVALSKSANSPRYAADLIVRAISHPDTYVFAELLYKSQIQALATADPEYAAYLTLLQIFSYGTYDDYKRGTAPSTSPPTTTQQTQEPSSSAASTSTTPAHPLPPLDDAQTSKLRQLSLLSLAKDRASLGYDHLEQALHLLDRDNNNTTTTTSTSEAADAALETLVLSAVYAGLLQATLDPARRVVRVSSVAPVRDPAPGAAALATLHTALQQWSARCETTLAGLDAQIAGIRQAAAERAAEARQWNTRFDKAVEMERRTLRSRPQ